MDKPILTFEDIIRLNGHDWDQAYAVLTYHLEKGNIKKEVLKDGTVIYHNPTQVQGHNLIHDKIFTPKIQTRVVMRPRRTRINKDEGKE
ncbi:hypothetical protein [Algoriphagus aquimarinus]|uniref:Uncharacterized protein n=1 Tax=Algoriphagus aquimarinus TaxID=237018 RepID=A0A5C7A8S9_9BACT|nr:hypothetical protein [Algoriphagus aquimarinus]TXE01845.1 hypothetical protein ESV85_21885 [Algoriphagus aquimarinus]